MGFEEDIRGILAAAPKTSQRALFSATMPNSLQSIVREHLGDYEQIRIQNKTTTVEKINQRFVMVRHDQKLNALLRLLEHETYDAMLIFVRTKASASELAEKLEARGYSATPLSGDLNQALRERTINRLKEGLVDIVVATDVAARGLDVDRITHVLNFDVPYDTESYVHRIGRTGRAGREGNAILFITPRERSMLSSIERATRQQITPMDLPTNAQIQSKRVNEFKEKLVQIATNEDLDKFKLLVETWATEEAMDITDIAASLMYLAQKDSPLYEVMQEVPKAFARDERSDRGDRSSYGRNERPDRSERPERSFDRGDRPQRAPRDDSDPHKAEEGYDRYYIGVGREHRITPGDIVGAIANEANINSSNIGRIKLHPFFSTVELPQGIDRSLLGILSQMTIRGNPSKFRLMTDEPPPAYGGGAPGAGDDRGPRGERSSFPRRSFGDKKPGGGFGGGKPFGGKPRGGFGGRGK